MKYFPSRENRDELRLLLENYKKFLRGEPFDFIEEDDFLQIIAHFNEQEQYANALQAVSTALDLFSYSAPLHVIKADVLVSMKNYEEALLLINKAEILDGNEISVYIIKTEVLLAMDRQDEAARILEHALDLFTGEQKIELLFELSDVYDDFESFDKVFDCLKWILEIDPENEEALYKICFWTEHTGRNEESIKLHLKITDAYPFNELAWFNLGTAYQGIKLYEKAVDAYEYAVAINDKFDYAFRNMGDAFMRLKKYKEAIESLEKVISLTLPEMVIYEAIGYCYDKLDNFAQARFHYRKASHLNPDDSQLYFKIAVTYMNQGNWKSAIKSLHSALKIQSLQPEYNLAMGRCMAELDAFEEAFFYLGNVIRIRPKNSNGWIELLKCLYRGGLYEEGFEYAVQAFESTDSKPIFVCYKSAFLFASGQTKEALKYLEYVLMTDKKWIKKFIEIDPSFLQNQLIIDLIARYKATNKRKK
jgi:tetratricopeptide (TPR) repeat protein